MTLSRGVATVNRPPLYYSYVRLTVRIGLIDASIGAELGLRIKADKAVLVHLFLQHMLVS